MSAAALDRLLAILIAAQLATGLLTLRAGVPVAAPLFAAHGLLGGALLAAVALKLRRSLPKAMAGRRWMRLAVAALVALATAAALGGGFAWVASGRILTIGPWTVLTLHVGAALVLLPLAALHLLPGRWRLLRVRTPRGGPSAVSRRTVLRIMALGALGGIAWVAANALDALAGGSRRFTGSRWLADGGVPPATTFFGERTPSIDPDAWRLSVTGRVRRPLSLSLPQLAALGQTDRWVVLDCTSGWALRTSWHGVPLAAILGATQPLPASRRVVVRSTTGWYADLPLAEARGALLATGVGGASLRAANGAPCRLVAPDRRGLEWVKWVASVEVV